MSKALEFMLSFQRNPNSKFDAAKFETYDELQSYIATEGSDFAVKKAFAAHGAALTKGERATTGAALDKARNNAYMKWIKQKEAPPNNDAA